MTRSATERKRALPRRQTHKVSAGWERSEKRRRSCSAFDNITANRHGDDRCISCCLREEERERYIYLRERVRCGACDLRVQFAFRAALPVDRFLPGYLVFQAHVTPQVGSTTESGVADDAGSLVAMHFEVLGQRG